MNSSRSSSRRIIGFVVGAIGFILLVGVFIKAVFIGYYDDELITMIIVGAVGLGLMWVAERLFSASRA